jgi:hypothetical protein
MPFRDELAARRYRVEASEAELSEIQAAIRECDAALAARLDTARTDVQRRYELLRGTHDPDICKFRMWHSKILFIGFGLTALGLIFAIFGNSNAGILFALFGAVFFQGASLRTVVSRRDNTFDLRFPWSPRAYRTTKPIAPEHIAVRLDLKRKHRDHLLRPRRRRGSRQRHQLRGACQPARHGVMRLLDTASARRRVMTNVTSRSP